ncbi:hypothetical protein HOY80DRAFT_1029400 [Tuber brumale]|nr:hypothetical protein HOY80DRAFT_1029400 [Tuber brumale]
MKGLSKKNEKRSLSQGKENQRGSSDEEKVSGEVRELQEMMQDQMQLQKASITPRTGAVAGCTEEDVISLETYAVGEGYTRYPYSQQDAEYPVTRHGGYLSRRSQVLHPVEFYQGSKGMHPAVSEGAYREAARSDHRTR